MKNLMIILMLVSVLLVAGCGNQVVDDTDQGVDQPPVFSGEEKTAESEGTADSGAGETAQETADEGAADTEEEIDVSSFSDCKEAVFNKVCDEEGNGLVYTEYTEESGVLVCTDDGQYSFFDYQDATKYLQINVPMMTVEKKCNVYEDPANPEEKCKLDYYQELCEEYSMDYTDFRILNSEIVCTDDGIYRPDDEEGKIKVMEVSFNTVKELCS